MSRLEPPYFIDLGCRGSLCRCGGRCVVVVEVVVVVVECEVVLINLTLFVVAHIIFLVGPCDPYPLKTGTGLARVHILVPLPVPFCTRIKNPHGFSNP